MVDPVGSPTPAPDGSDALKAQAEAVRPIELAINRQRIPLTVDPFGQNGQALVASLLSSRMRAVSNLYLGMQEVHTSLGQLLALAAAPTAPPQLLGVLLQPDATAAGLVQVQFDPSTLNNSSPKVTVQTDPSGTFTLPLPKNMPLPTGSNLELHIHGASGNATVQVPSSQIAANGLVGAIMLPQFIAPLPLSIVAALQALVPPSSTASLPPPPTNQPQLPVIHLGEDENLLSYGVNKTAERYPFGVFFRLVEPRASIVSQVQAHPANGNKVIFLPNYEGTFTLQVANSPQPAVVPVVPGAPPATPDDGLVTYVDRVPVEQPISVDGFRDQMMGLLPNGTFTADETRPMAGTLGLSYVLWMSQQWTFQGLALGDLVYSLPLAPGEQQQVAIFERVDTASVSESEFFTEEQALRQSALADTSTQATFNSAFNEVVNGSSHFHTQSDSSSWGGSLILISGGSGSSTSDGTTSQSLEGQRNTSQQAAQSTHSAAESQASARRNAARTGMRIATASESEQITTKVITNHNHTKALTMQYWKVHTAHDVTTAIDGLTLSVLVPLQLVRFMPPGQPLLLSSANQVASRVQVLARYSSIIKHGDVLAQALPRRFQHGLTMLLQFASDPTVQVTGFGSAAENVIQFKLAGSFVPCEDIFVTVVTDRNTRVGPVKLTNTASAIPKDKFATQEQLIEWLMELRQSGGQTFSGALALPPSLNRNNVVGFEISRNFQQVSYTLISPAMAELNALRDLFGANTTWVDQGIQSVFVPGTSGRTTVFLNPAELEKALDGPPLHDFQAGINDAGSPQEQYAKESLIGTVLPPQPYPVAARQLAPVLRYNEILEIERMAEHVVRNTLLFSRAVWASMSEYERAILLEAYTIGVPPDGVVDATQMVPLLNCVENRVLGFFGNSMILPFNIPQGLAQHGRPEGQEIHPAKIQEALLAYHTAGFTPPHSTVTLPTQGVLGEAVLGQSPSAEKIDLTRFWKWQDSPADTAPVIAPSTLPTASPSIAAGLTAPNSLTNLPSLINNVLTAPTPDSALLQALAKSAASQQDFSGSLTGAEQLASLLTNAQNNANTARSEALKTTKDLTAQAIATVANLYGGAENPNAGTNAAAAVTGGKTADNPQPKDAAKPGTTDKPGTGKTDPGTGKTDPGTGKTGPGTGTGGPTPAPGPPAG